jgi:hypothetical protein
MVPLTATEGKEEFKCLFLEDQQKLHAYTGSTGGCTRNTFRKRHSYHGCWIFLWTPRVGQKRHLTPEESQLARQDSGTAAQHYDDGRKSSRKLRCALHWRR